MTERPYSLIDVQLGMWKLDLNLLLTPPLFSFFWGLTMVANTLTPRFKNPFDLTVIQGQAAGGGNSRQALWKKQQDLKKVRIDKQWLVKIKSGNFQKNVPATYEINYNLLIPETLTMPVFEVQPSKIIDATIDGSVDGSVDRSVDHPKIRREEKEINTKPEPRPENKPSNRDAILSNGITRGELLDMIEFKPAVINYRNEEHMDILAYLGEQPREHVEWAVEQTKAKNIGANGILKWIYNGVDQYEYRMSLIPKKPPAAVPEEDTAINTMKQLIREYRTIGDNGHSRTGSTRQATINRLSPYRKWYDTIGNLGAIVGMELDEYESLMNGGMEG